MKKRLRKKRHVGEFKEYGASLKIVLKEKLGEKDFDAFVWDFIDAAVVPADCSCSGGGSHDELELRFFMDLGAGAEEARGRLAAVTAWLAKDKRVASSAAGALTDAWYGPFGA